ncbi:mRNA export protein mlo3 [Grifola frondosa]|uniref:mRNA export protein mlo3 n=1 Tax=Grifola frondosa TaxID=5627 RepID=A0A1C7LSY1_GRIFR|nr:mRNA export protein mlo3 [Grifola frondosa]
MDKSLDDIIASRPRGIRRTNTVPIAATAQQPADKIIVSNLPPDVNELQVKELFHTTVGPLKDVTLHYDSQGRSKGVAAVHFQRRGDGTKAFQQYNNRLIDGTLSTYCVEAFSATAASQGSPPLGWLSRAWLVVGRGDGNVLSLHVSSFPAAESLATERPMKIEIIVDPSRPVPPASLASRVAPAPSVPVETAPRTGGGRPRRGRGGGGVRGRKSNERPNKSAADLDAEMEDYSASNAPAAAT